MLLKSNDSNRLQSYNFFFDYANLFEEKINFSPKTLAYIVFLL